MKRFSKIKTLRCLMRYGKKGRPFGTIYGYSGRKLFIASKTTLSKQLKAVTAEI